MAGDKDNKAAQALAYLPVLLARLNGNECHMLAAMLQAIREGGYADGFADGTAAAFGKEKQCKS